MRGLRAPSGKGRFLIRRNYWFGQWHNQVVEWGDALAYGTPLAGDLMGGSTESKDELVVVNVSYGGTAVWHIIMDPYDPLDLTKQTSFAWGIEGDVFLTCKVPNATGQPLRAAVYRPSAGKFIVRVPEAVGGKVESVAFGRPGDVPACIDVDGNGTDDFVLWRPSERPVANVTSRNSRDRFRGTPTCSPPHRMGCATHVRNGQLAGGGSPHLAAVSAILSATGWSFLSTATRRAEHV